MCRPIGSSLLLLAAVLIGLLSSQDVRAQHVTDGRFTSPSEWNTNRSSVTSQSFASAPDGSGGSRAYAEHVFPAAPNDPNSPDMFYLMADYTGTPAGANVSNTTFNFFMRQPATYCQGDFLFQIGPGGFNAYQHDIANPLLINQDGTIYLGDGSLWQGLNQDDLDSGNLLATVGLGSSPNSLTDHLMAEMQISVFEQYGSAYRDGILSPDTPTFVSISVSGPVNTTLASGYVTINSDGTTTWSLTDPDVPSFSVLSHNNSVSMFPQEQQEIVIVTPEGGALSLLGAASACALALARRFKQARKSGVS